MNLQSETELSVDEKQASNASDREEGSSSPCEEVVPALDKAKSLPDQVEELIEVPPPVPKSGSSVLAHKLWIGNLDKRLTE